MKYLLRLTFNALFVFSVFATIISVTVGWHWLYSFWFNYEVPSLYGNGPEAVTEILVVGLISYAIYPRFRTWVNSAFAGLHDKIESDKAEHHSKLDAIAAELHAKLDDLHTKADELHKKVDKK